MTDTITRHLVLIGAIWNAAAKSMRSISGMISIFVLAYLLRLGSYSFGNRSISRLYQH